MAEKDKSSIDRILAAMKEAPDGDKIDTSNVDKALLWKDIESVFTVRLLAEDLEHLPLFRRQRREIAAKARELKHLLEINRAEDGAIGMFYPRALSDYREVIAALEQAAERAAKPQDPLFEGDERAGEVLRAALTSGSLFQVSIARLMFIYEKHFEDDAGYTKKDNEVDPDAPPIFVRPFIRFADAALRELRIIKSNGERYSDSYIADAVTNVRNGRAPMAKSA
jgi:hypothetical protein